MIIPNSLKKGDTVAIVATARKISEQEIDFAIKWLENLGYKVVLGSTIGLEFHQFAGTDLERAADFQNALDNPEIKAIWCARGGYGTIRMIDLVDFSNFDKKPKWIIGYSDITVLHSKLHNLGVASIHAPMPVDIEKASAEAKKSLANALCGNYTSVEFNATKNNKIGEAVGLAIGGNLSVLYSMCGSETAINTDGKILFLEDLDEYYYHMDRMLKNLARNGMFKNLAGLVVGGMNNMHDNNIPFGFSIAEMILELTKNYKYPVVFGAPFGHIKDNRAFVFGREIKLQVTVQNVIVNI